MKKYHRRYIRMGDKLHASPKFLRSKDAEAWYQEMLKKKHFERHGLKVPIGDSGIKFIDYCRDWMAMREKEYPLATTSKDDQRLRDYVLPYLADYPVARIQRGHVRMVLTKISRAGFKKTGQKLSAATLDRVKALMSAIFTSAMNEEPALIDINPAWKLDLKMKRSGKRKPLVLEDKNACVRFLEAARTLDEKSFVMCSTFLMAGLRKQELIALKWRCLRVRGWLEISEKYEQASNSILKGTKAGELTTRRFALPEELVTLLERWRAMSDYSADTDFVFPNRDGRFLNARTVTDVINRVRRRAGLNITTHGLRHTYGREFALNTGNLKALQAILGHSSSATTDIYSELAGERLKGFKESVTFGVGRHTD